MADRYFAEGLLAGQVSVVTGGSSGIGLAIATSFASLGSDVVIIGRTAEKLDHAASLIEESTRRSCMSLVCDVRDAEAVGTARDRVAERFGPATILVNNAAANFRMAAEKMTGRAFATVLDIDLVGTFNATSAFVGDMLSRSSGVVLNVVVPDAERGFPGYSHAGAAKAGIISLTRSWAREWGGRGVRVNALGPGPVPTEGVAANMLGLRESGSAFHDVVDRVPLGRLGTVQDIADAATFLCGPAAAWITGVSLTVDGGLNVA